MAFIRCGGGGGGSDIKTAEGFFTTSTSQYGIVDVNCGFKPDLIIVALPLGGSGDDTVCFWWNKLSYATEKAIWALAPRESASYAVNLGRTSGETGIQQINANGFSFMSNAGNTRGVTCTYRAIKFGRTKITYKNYAKFNNYGFFLPFTIDSDYKITVEFYDTQYVNDNRILDNSMSSNYARLVVFQNTYWASTGTSQSGIGVPWSSGAHTFVINNGNNKNEFDGVEVQNYTPTTVNAQIGLGASYVAGGISNVTYISRFKIESISTGDLICDLRPALIDDISPCMYDEVNDTFYAPNGISVFDSIS